MCFGGGKSMNKRYGQWKMLTAAVLLVMGTPLVSQGVSAETVQYENGISGNIGMDQQTFKNSGFKVKEKTVKDEFGDKKVVGAVYDFGGKDHTFRVVNEDGIGAKVQNFQYEFKNVDASGKKGTLHIYQINDSRNDYLNVSGIEMDSQNTITLESNLDITAHSAYAAKGVGVSKGTDLVIQGNVKMRKADSENPWAITTKNLHGNFGVGGYPDLMPGENGQDYAGARWHPSGFHVSHEGGYITVHGNVDIAVRGTAVQADAYGSRNGLHAYDFGVISLLGDSVRIETPVNQKSPDGDFLETMYSLASYGGTVNINVKDSRTEKKNPQFSDLSPTGGKTEIVGNAIILKRSPNTTHLDTYQDGRVNVALTTKDSSWRGVVDNAGAEHAGELNVWLSHGAQWIHEEASPTDGMQHKTMPKYSKPDYGIFDGVSYVEHLVGGNTRDDSGFITQNSKVKLHVADYSGHNTIIYKHTEDGTDKAHYIGGDTTIVHADPGSGITLVTGNNGIDVNNEDVTGSVFQTLASKLTYENYTKKEGNLSGKLVIASGLTSSSVTENVVGRITFDDTTGIGGYVKPRKGEQTTETLSEGITGNEKKDKTYIDSNIRKEDDTYHFTVNPSTVIVKDGTVVKAEENVDIDASKVTLNLNGKTGIETEGKKVDIKARTLHIGTENNKTGQGIVAKGGEVSVTGETNILAKTEAIHAENQGKVTVGNGRIVGNIVSDGGDITINKDRKPGSLTGNIEIAKEGKVDITVAGANQAFTGDIKKKENSAEGEQDGKIFLVVTDGAKWKGAVETPDAKVNLDLDGGSWKNTGTKATTLTELQGGQKFVKTIEWKDPATKKDKKLPVNGFISMEKGAGELTIEHYSGTHIIHYRHDNDGTQVTDYQGGDTNIKEAEENSIIIAATDARKIRTSQKEEVEKTFAALAQKIYYENAGKDKNLTGKVLISSGLTASSRARWIGDMTFDETKQGQGTYTKGTGLNIAGDFETAIMKGARGAMTGALMTWRRNADDLIYRGDRLRTDMETEGLWARVYGGEDSYKENGVEIKQSLTGLQVGYDKIYPGRVIAGVAIDYETGKADYLYDDDDFGTIQGNNGKTKIYSIGFYGSRDLGNNDHWDLTLKAGNVGTIYDVYNGIGMKLHGDYNDRAYAVSTRYGKKFGDDKTYIEPQMKFTWTHVGTQKYIGKAGEDELQIEQGHFDSLVGKIGIEAGYQGEKAGIHGRVQVAHEFNGSVNGTYYADDGGEKSTKLSMKDTWVEVGVGGTLRVGENATADLHVSKTFGGKYSEDWRVNGSVRLVIGQGVTPGSHSGIKSNDMRMANGGQMSATGQGENQGVVDTQGVATHPQTTKKVKTITETKTVTTMVPVERQTAAETTVTYGAPQGTYAKENGTPVYTLGEVVVTARRVEQPILEAKTDISVVTRKEIEESHMGSVEDVLRTVPGTQFLDYGANGMNANLSGVRINGSKDVLVLIDGVRVSAFQGTGASGYMYSSFLKNMDNIERVEVLRGAAAVVYGSEAKGGVINIITRKVNNSKTTIDVAKGSFGKEEARLATQGRRGKISYHVNYDKFIDGNMRDGAGKLWEGHTNSRHISAKLGYDMSDKQKVTLAYSEGKTNYNGRDYIRGDFEEGDPYYGTYSSKLTSLTHDLTLSDKWSNKLTYRDSKDTSIYYKPKGEGSNTGKTESSDEKKPYVAGYNHDYTFISDQLTYMGEKHSVVLGIDFMKGEGNDVNSGTGLNLRDHWVKNISVFAQEEWKLLPNLAVTFGVRHDRPSTSAKSGDIPTSTGKSFKVSYDMTKKDSIYASKNDFFIIPSMTQFFDPDYGNEKLLPSSGYTKSIGYNHAFSDANYITVNWFDTITKVGSKWEKVLDKDGNQEKDKNGNLKWKQVNYEGGRSMGWNAQYNTKLGENWEARLGWAHLNYNEPDNFGMGYAPKDKATFALYLHKDKWSAAFDGFYFIRDMSGVDPKKPKGWPSDNYAVCNMALNYRPTEGTEFYFKMNNIFNKLWAEHTDTIHGNTNPEAWYSMPGRSFLFGMKHSF